MRFKKIVFSQILLTFFVLCFQGTAMSQTPKTAEQDPNWKLVEQALQQGLPKTAIEKLDVIVTSSFERKAFPEAIKALGQKISLSAQIAGGQMNEPILLLKEQLTKAPKEVTPVLHSILANWYWTYFEQNRWRFANRTATATTPSEDIATWDLARLFKEIDAAFTIALASEEDLKKIPIETYDALLTKGNLPDSYRPTLFDFVAFNAIDFYSAGEQAGVQAQDAFEIEASSQALGPTIDFLKWEPKSTDTASTKLKAIRLYQKLLRNHREDTDRSAYLDSDLSRLRFGFAHAVGEEKDSRYKAMLKAFADANATHELSSIARSRLATVLQSENDLVEAREVALQGKNAFPNSVGARQCQNIIQTIEAKSLDVSSERVWNEPMPSIRVRYRNVSQVYFRVVPLTWEDRLTADRWIPSQLNDQDRQRLLDIPPSAQWKSDLPATDDYQEATHDISIPQKLEPGFYMLVSSSKADFSEQDNVVSVCETWVSNLALIVRQDWGAGSVDGFVLDARTGEPIGNARVRSFVRSNRNNGRLTEAESKLTDSNGRFSFLGDNKNLYLLASYQRQQLATANEVAMYKNQQAPKAQVQHVLFTDRSIYRPGQSIYFKGIAMLADQDKGKYQVVPNHPIVVVFNDPNGKTIAKLELKSNDFGSVQGVFTAPRDRGTGQMTVQITGTNGTTAAVRVEEYKRPKFQVSLDAPKEAAKLNQPTTLTGKATSYTGAAIDGAKVRYRITRGVRFPDWFLGCFAWRLPPTMGQQQEIANGWATTEADGSFQINFTPTPDRSVPESDSPIFTYLITADVTDSTGETRTETKSISVGYVALQIQLRMEDWLTTTAPVLFSLSAQTLDGVGQSAKGALKLYKLKEPDKVLRPDLLGYRFAVRNRLPGHRDGRQAKPALPSRSPMMLPDPSDPNNWELAEVVQSKDFQTKEDGSGEVSFDLSRGHYRVVVESQDRFGKSVTAQKTFAVIDPKATSLGLKLPNILQAPRWSLEPEETLQAIWGSGYDSARAFVEVEHRGKMLQSFWTKPGVTQVAIEQAIDETMRGGLTIRTTSVRENRAYTFVRNVDVPWTNKDLKLKWSRFSSKLDPAAKEKFTLTISGPKATKVAAELVATLFDASLDAYARHQWMNKLSVFRSNYSSIQSTFQNMPVPMMGLKGAWAFDYVDGSEIYRSLPPELSAQVAMLKFRGVSGGAPGGFGAGRAMLADSAAEFSMARAAAPMAANYPENSSTLELSAGEGAGNDKQNAASNLDLSQVSVRSNLNESAFFFPQLVTKDDGSVEMEFTMPEALTKWRFMGFAHDRELRSGFLEDSLVTAKDLMIQPNPPRFLREGDILEFSAKVSNQSGKPISGKVELQLQDAITVGNVDAKFENSAKSQSFTVEAMQSKSFTWRLRVPDGATPIIYKVVAASEKLSDGEEGMLPVLSKRLLVTESLPLPIRGKTTREFELKKLLESAGSKTLKHQSLTVQMTSQPAWYAVLALPYLMEFPHECSEQTFNRLYANALARHITKSDPKIKRVFDAWRAYQPKALDSPLSKNQDIKSVMIEETPWLRASDDESAARRNVAELFNENRLDSEIGRAMQKLTELQQGDGLWPWFPGGRRNEYLSLYIVTGFGRLKQFKVDMDYQLAIRAVDQLDAWMQELHREILNRKNDDPKSNHLSSLIAMYLYGRSFFMAEVPVAADRLPSFEYWKSQARQYWLQLGNRQSQAQIAIALKRMGDAETPKGIMASLKERSLSSEEMGMYWQEATLSWWWYQAPIETHAMMIEAFDEVANDAKSVEECKVWLLKQKQTQNWKTTKATADAIYALLLRGTNLLSSEALVQVDLAGEKLVPQSTEAGTGFYEQKFSAAEVKASMGKVKLTKVDDGVSWGGIHWQYLEDISKVLPHDGTPLKLEKKLFKKTLGNAGPVLEELTGGACQVGDELVCRIVLRTDRDMEYIHMKDHRGSGTEPTNVLSQYKFQDGLAYYESTRDTATNFFIDYLSKGTYVFEYSVRVQHAGEYPSGLASIQCMYAPEFNSHSESVMITATKDR